MSFVVSVAQSQGRREGGRTVRDSSMSVREWESLVYSRAVV